jgi:cytoskeleton-associated protein 5
MLTQVGLTDVLEEIQEGMKHKNPQVKTETLRFLVRCLRTTPLTPLKPEIATIGESTVKLLGESFAPTRDAAAEALGTLTKIIGERAMIQYLEGVDDLRKAKIKEFFEKAEIKARARPEPKPVAPKAKTTGAPRPTSMRPGTGKPAPLKRRVSTMSNDKEPDSPKKPTIARPGVKPPASRMTQRQSMAPARMASPTPAGRKSVEDTHPVAAPAPKLARGLLGRVYPLLI